MRLFNTNTHPPSLNGQICLDCGRVSFPPNQYGCEGCGAAADQLDAMPLTGRGRLTAFVTTHHANQRDIAVPYTVASIALDDGPVIRALMKEPTDEGLEIGARVEAVEVVSPDGSESKASELRFELGEAA
ncbi:Zn-ribbon domain-containing OB-fold protein [Parasphingorhabdus sp.]|uniref:Zn-ribbon domain-containing OB-fold protein n=1 Tax=Parasphingorhabdus sp. TaxID=2709688 RepID=UPI003A930281